MPDDLRIIVEAIAGNRSLLNQIVDRINVIEIEFQLIRQEVQEQGRLLASFQRVPQGREKLTPLPHFEKDTSHEQG